METNSVIVNILLRSANVTSKFSAEFYMLQFDTNPEIIELIKNKYNITSDHIGSLRTMIKNCSDDLLEKMVWWCGRLFQSEFEMLMKSIADINYPTGFYLYQNKEKISFTEIQVLTLKRVFKIKEEEKYVFDEDKENLKNKVEELGNIIELKNKRITQLQEDCGFMSVNNSVLQDKLESQTRELERVKIRNKTLEKTNNEMYATNLQKKDNEIESLKKMIEQLKDHKGENMEIERLKKTVTSLNTKILGFVSQVESLDKENETLNELLRQCEIEMDEKEREVEEMRIKVVEAEKVQRSLEDVRLELLKTRDIKSKDPCATQMIKMNEMDEQIRELKTRLRHTEDDNKKLQSEVFKMTRIIRGEVVKCVQVEKKAEVERSKSVKEKLKMYEGLCEKSVALKVPERSRNSVSVVSTVSSPSYTQKRVTLGKW
ncbi:hypothetical protein EIN_060860 [Entamoeba invadens IP1]|uniref:hypothetical protein n=1 Tax=Entamoeba invadens IP1 TaxID=370355 RepID=UPI0002C3F9B4|nr:hypothetical protein EIN_060860 [Entamoeba invadens IP1]ELP93531.1 hypothetical protein EIN_060860 [Entamoeba invadens IP1]|eukprot:XP_004260302.1 hypothetical protein EIN_060860 [Entamoeba invadens IP1]